MTVERHPAYPETSLRDGALLQEMDRAEDDRLIVGEVQLVLAEKRTSLAALRTGIAVLVLPLSALSLLIATSGYYEFFRILYLIIPLFILNGALSILSGYLIIRSILKMYHQDKLINELKKRHPMIAPFVD